MVITCDQTNILPNHIHAHLMKADQFPFGLPTVSGPDNLQEQQANVHRPPADTHEVESCIDAQAIRQHYEISIRRALEKIFHHDNAPSLSLNHIRELVEKNYFELLLKKHKTQRKTAQVLGIDHTTLSRKIKKWRVMPGRCDQPQEYTNSGDRGSEEDAPNAVDVQYGSDNRCNPAYTNLKR
jgi:DNA-binding NtrC family response regulator